MQAVSQENVQAILNCAVCLVENDRNSVTTNCAHLYHVPCIERIIQLEPAKRLCPLCGAAIRATTPIPFAMLELLQLIKPVEAGVPMEVVKEKVSTATHPQLPNPVPKPALAPIYVPENFACPPKLSDANNDRPITPSCADAVLLPLSQNEEVDLLRKKPQYSLDEIICFREILHSNTIQIIKQLKMVDFPQFLVLLPSIAQNDAGLNSIKSKWEIGNQMEAVIEFINSFHMHWNWNEFLSALAFFKELANELALFQKVAPAPNSVP
jgi:hypothetical protein